jgi:putative heme iron utilization protein
MKRSEILKAMGLGVGLGAIAALGFFLSMAPAFGDEKPMKEFEHQDAVDLAKSGKIGSLGTEYKGSPFVSLTPYAVDAKGRPFLYISDLAVHTKNLKAKAESSLMVMKVDEDNLFNSARISFVGKTTLVTDEKEVAALKKVYYAKYPDAEVFEQLHDFGFWRMEVSRIHYIGGFGDIRWIEAKEWTEGYK